MGGVVPGLYTAGGCSPQQQPRGPSGGQHSPCGPQRLHGRLSGSGLWDRAIQGHRSKPLGTHISLGADPQHLTPSVARQSSVWWDVGRVLGAVRSVAQALRTSRPPWDKAGHWQSWGMALLWPHGKHPGLGGQQVARGCWARFLDWCLALLCFPSTLDKSLCQ